MLQIKKKEIVSIAPLSSSQVTPDQWSGWIFISVNSVMIKYGLVSILTTSWVSTESILKLRKNQGKKRKEEIKGASCSSLTRMGLWDHDPVQHHIEK
jgi:hypothetical protein